jgi:hypothetical protein
LIATPDSSPLPRVASISAKMNGCTAMTSLSIFIAVSITSRYSANVDCDLSTITCALTPSTLSLNCCVKPVVTANTHVSAATPSATPSTDTLVNTLKIDSSTHTIAATKPTSSSSTANAFSFWISSWARPTTATPAAIAAAINIERSMRPP